MELGMPAQNDGWKGKNNLNNFLIIF